LVRFGLAIVAEAYYRMGVRMLSAKLPDDVAARLDRESKRSRRSRSELVRHALQEMFEAGSEGGRATLADVLSEIEGTVEGPSDLSSNPDHLAGFGR